MSDNLNYDELDLRVIQNSGRLDANESLFFARQLEYIKAQTYDIKRVPLGAMTLMPVSTSTPEGATTITYRQYDTVGIAKVIANYGNDLPRADVVGKEFINPIRTIANAYGYNTQEIRSAQFAGVNLTGKKANAAARAHYEKINQLAFSGDVEHGLPGFLTNPNIPSVTLAADGTGSSKTFASKTSAQIVRDVNLLINQVIIQSKGFHRPNQVWLPITAYTQMLSTQNSINAGDTTIMGFLRANFPGIEFKSVIEMTGAGAGGVDRMYAMDNSMDNWQLELPMMVKTSAPQAQGLEFVVPMESRFAGVIVEYPLAFAYADGV